MDKTKYGILRVDMLCMDNETPKMVRHWVLKPDTTPKLFDSLETAQGFADGMLKEARLHGIQSGYRARAFTTGAVKDI